MDKLNSTNYKETPEERKERISKALGSIKHVLLTSEKYSKKISSNNRSDNKKLIDLNDNYYSETPRRVLQELNKIKLHKTSVKNEKSTKAIKYFKGKLYQYQEDGLNWMNNLFKNSINGILADEMGLGKTVQIIALMCSLYERKEDGPHLIMVPLSTLPNWKSEFERFAPSLPVITFHGNRSELHEKFKKITEKKYLDKTKVSPIILAPIHTVSSYSRGFLKISWNYHIIDEGHIIKNPNTGITKLCKSLKSKHRLLLTGTPLQNNITELWSLFNFLMPQLFKSCETFSSLLLLTDMNDMEEFIQIEAESQIVETLHKILAPFILRRLKKDVVDIIPKKEIIIYCPLTPLQKKLYTDVLDYDIAALTNTKSEDEVIDLDAPRPKRRCVLYKNIETAPHYENTIEEKLQYILKFSRIHKYAMLKKIVNHPYLIRLPIDPKTGCVTIDESLVEASGKMMILDQLLKKLKLGGHKVLIFSTYKIILDVIEDMINLRDWKYVRLDGTYKLDERSDNIKQFMDDPETFIFLITTRAGGVGLNLMAADTVILFDRDWNPQADIQAQARCHRIGQTRPVIVYSFIVKNTIDERILLRSDAKRKLEKVVLPDNIYKTTNPDDLKATDLKELRELLQKDDVSVKIHNDEGILSEDEWNRILDRTITEE